MSLRKPTQWLLGPSPTSLQTASLVDVNDRIARKLGILNWSPAIVAGTAPAAGAEISDTVPTGQTWYLFSFSFKLVTSATVATRTPRLIIDDGTDPLWLITFDTQTASLTISYAPGLGTITGQASVFDFATVGLLPLVLPAGFRLRTVTTNIQVGDQYSAVKYLRARLD